MTTRVLCAAAAGLGLAGILSTAAIAAEFPNPLPAETIPRYESLPAKYPTSWAFINYPNDRFELRDVGSDTRDVKGQIPAHDSGTLLVADKRPELYVADTVWSRGTRGVRTDFITIFDKQTLNPTGEIVLPGTKRALIVDMEGMMAFTDDQRMALVFNFTPASSVTVVDLVKRQVLGEVEIPGCSLIYPTGSRGFSTLCASGTLLTVRLDANGAVTGRSESKAFNPLDTDPLFTSSATLGGVRYFASLHGRIQPIDMRADDVKILPDWPLVTAADEAGHWRPSGWQVVASDDQKLLYVLMQPHAHEGTHKDPATEVWVYNAGTKSRVKRFRLARPGASIVLTHGAEPMVLVQSGARLDVYEPGGNLLRSLDLPGASSSVQLETVRP
jgi:methylamine dehydrogenase heavy chain